MQTSFLMHEIVFSQFLQRQQINLQLFFLWLIAV